MFEKDMAKLRGEDAELKRLELELGALFKRVDLLAERSEPGFLELRLFHLLECKPQALFVGPQGTLVGRTPDGCAIVVDTSGVQYNISVPRDRQQLRNKVEKTARAQLARMSQECGAQWLNSHLQQMHACQHRLRQPADVSD